MKINSDAFQKANTAYYKIPGDHKLDSNSIRDMYVTERKALKSPAELIAFTQRWNPLYTLPFPRELIDICPEELAVIASTYDPVSTWECIQKNTKPNNTCEHCNPDDEELNIGCPAAFILVPIILLLAGDYSHEFSIPVNAAIFQMCLAAMTP